MDKKREVDRLIEELKPVLTCDTALYDWFSMWDCSLTRGENKSLILNDLKEKGLIKADTYNEFKEMSKAIKDADIIEAEEKEALKAVFTPITQTINFKNLFDKPKIIGICGAVNSGKTNLINYCIEYLEGRANIYTYGNKTEFKGAKTIYSITEMEKLNDSVIFLDEIMSLWDLNNRHEVKIIEKTLRLLNHLNNIIIICGVEDSFRKFIASKIDIWIFKMVKIPDFINGSRAKNVLMDYKGKEIGTTILNLKLNEALIFDGNYSKIDIPYIKHRDTKLNNIKIVSENVINPVIKSVGEKKPIKFCNKSVINNVQGKEPIKALDAPNKETDNRKEE